MCYHSLMTPVILPKVRWQVVSKYANTLDPVKSELADLCCPDIVWGPIREMNSHATHQGMLVNSHLSWLSHCRLVLALKWNWCMRADLHPSKKRREKAQARNDSLNLPQKFSYVRTKPPPPLCLQVKSGGKHLNVLCLNMIADRGKSI